MKLLSWPESNICYCCCISDLFILFELGHSPILQLFIQHLPVLCRHCERYWREKGEKSRPFHLPYGVVSGQYGQEQANDIRVSHADFTLLKVLPSLGPKFTTTPVPWQLGVPEVLSGADVLCMTACGPSRETRELSSLHRKIDK